MFQSLPFGRRKASGGGDPTGYLWVLPDGIRCLHIFYWGSQIDHLRATLSHLLYVVF